MSRETFNKKVDRLRSILDKIEERYPDAIILERYRGLFQKITTPNPKAEWVRSVEKKIDEALASEELSSLDGYRRSVIGGIKTLNEAGLDFINEKNFNHYMRFLNDAQARGLGAIYDSDRIVNFIREAKQMGLTQGQIRENIRRWAAKYVKYDRDGKVIEVENPPELKVVKVRVLHPDRRRKKKGRVLKG